MDLRSLVFQKLLQFYESNASVRHKYDVQRSDTNEVTILRFGRVRRVFVVFFSLFLFAK